MPNFSDNLADRVVDHTLDLYRFDSGERARILRLLGLLKKEIADKLMVLDLTTIAGRRREQRLLKLFSDIEDIIKKYYSMISKSSAEAMRDLAVASAAFAGTSINAAAGITLVSDYAFSSSFIKALVSDVMIEGAPSKEWWSRQAGGTLQRFKDQIRMGLVAGESNRDLVKRVVGINTGRTQIVTFPDGTKTRVPVYAGGIIETSARNAESLVRSSVQAVANAARMEVFQANSDIIMGVQALVVLDGRTSFICMGRSEAVWDLEGNPLQGVDYPLPGIPPWHWNCRTILIPILYDWQTIENTGKIKTAPDGATKASMDGQVAADLSWEDWLKSKPEAFQRKKLGKTRYELWQQGKLTIKDLSDQFNRILTVEDLLNRIAA